MLALKALVVVMGVLIVAGVGVIAVTVANRMSPAPAPIASLLLDEPPGTHIVSAALSPERIAVTLQGGGPDRVVLVDTRAGRVLGHVSLAH